MRRGGRRQADTNAIDASLKALFREAPAAILRLAGVDIDPRQVRVEDSTVNIPELRADHVFLLGEPDRPTSGVYVEYQLDANQRELSNWFAKCAMLNRQLGIPVALLVVYLRKGRRTKFPDRLSLSAGGLTTEFRFDGLRLWEHADLIESGTIPELAPLLVLCHEKPDERTIRQELQLIRSATVDERTKEDLLAIAMRIAARQFPRNILLDIFREEVGKMKGSSIIDDWIAEGEARGEARGKAEGKAEAAREFARNVLSKRFGRLPSAIDHRISDASAEWCAKLVDHALEVESLSELQLPEQN